MIKVAGFSLGNTSACDEQFLNCASKFNNIGKFFFSSQLCKERKLIMTHAVCAIVGYLLTLEELGTYSSSNKRHLFVYLFFMASVTGGRYLPEYSGDNRAEAWYRQKIILLPRSRYICISVFYRPLPFPGDFLDIVCGNFTPKPSGPANCRG